MGVVHIAAPRSQLTMDVRRARSHVRRAVRLLLLIALLLARGVRRAVACERDQGRRAVHRAASGSRSRRSSRLRRRPRSPTPIADAGPDRVADAGAAAARRDDHVRRRVAEGRRRVVLLERAGRGPVEVLHERRAVAGRRPRGEAEGEGDPAHRRRRSRRTTSRSGRSRDRDRDTRTSRSSRRSRPSSRSTSPTGRGRWTSARRGTAAASRSAGCSSSRSGPDRYDGRGAGAPLLSQKLAFG